MQEPAFHVSDTWPTVQEHYYAEPSNQAVSVETKAVDTEAKTVGAMVLMRGIERLIDPDHMTAALFFDGVSGKVTHTSRHPHVLWIGNRMVQDSIHGVMDSDVVLGAGIEPRLYPLSTVARFSQQRLIELLKSPAHHPRPESKERQWKGQVKKEVRGLLESGEAEEEVAPEAVTYACQVVDQLPSECAFLSPPDVSGFADKKAVYFEWLLESDGRMLLTVEPDGTVAYVCTFGNARSRNLGAWEDGIVDLMRPCFVKLVQLHEKDLHAWDASRTAHLSPDLSSKEKIR